MGLLDGVGDAVKGASELTAPANAPALAEAIKAALEGPPGQPGGSVLDVLSHMADVQVNLAQIVGALDHPVIDATAESQVNSTQVNEVMQGVIENLHSNAGGVNDDATVVAVVEPTDGSAGAHHDSAVSTSHVDSTPVHEDAVPSDPSAT
jgi:hypothetical protein